MKNRRWSVSTAFAVAFALATGGQLWAQTPGCGKGIIELPGNLNGSIQVCGVMDPRVPLLQKQLTEIQGSLKGNDPVLRELTHALRGVNALGRDIDSTRQMELLESLSRQLRTWMSAGQKQSQQQIAQLADKLDAVQDAITQRKEDTATAQQTAAELRGGLGDAIATLDLTKAQKQLDTIQARLDKIGDDTGQIRRSVGELGPRIDDLAARVDCSAATPPAMALALRALAADRVVQIWRCHPEISLDISMQSPIGAMFSPEEFSRSRTFLEVLSSAGFNFVRDSRPINDETEGYTPLARAFITGNIEALNWLIARSSKADWQYYPVLLEDLDRKRVGYRGPVPTAVQAISTLRNAGFPIDHANYKAFRQAYTLWLRAQDRASIGANFDDETAARWQAISDSLAPASQDVLVRVKSEVAAVYRR